MTSPSAKIRPLGATILVATLLLAACLRGDEQSRTSKVILSADGETQSFESESRLISELLAEAEVNLSPGDSVLAAGIPYSLADELPFSEIYNIQIRRAHDITLITEEGSHVISSSAATLGGGLLDGGIYLSVSDWLQPAANTPLTGSLSATLIRAKSIEICDGQQVIYARSAADTVGEALAEIGMSMQALDYTLPPTSDPIPEDGIIQIIRITEEVIIQQEPLPFQTVFQGAPEADIDTIVTLQTGEYGITSQRVRIRYQDGVEVARQVEDEWVSRQPTNRIQGYGTKITVKTMQTPHGPIEYWRAVEVYATSYAAKFTVRSPDDPRYGIMYNGKLLRTGYIAVLRSWYPSMAGRQYYVPNYGFGEVGDIGGGIAGKHWIDLGYSDDEYVAWYSWTTFYFLTPVPPADQILWVLP